MGLWNALRSATSLPVINAEHDIGIANYHVRGSSNRWFIEHDGKPKGSYETKESAFEAAVAAASLACRQGHEVTVTVPGVEEGEGTTGVADKGSDATRALPDFDKYCRSSSSASSDRRVLAALARLILSPAIVMIGHLLERDVERANRPLGEMTAAFGFISEFIRSHVRQFTKTMDVPATRQCLVSFTG